MIDEATGAIVPDPSQTAMRAKLAAKLAKAYAGVERLGKDRENKEFRYKFTSADALFAAVRNAFHDVGLAMVPRMVGHEAQEILDGSQKRRGVWLTCRFCFDIVDAETGYAETCPWTGEVAEYGDKAFAKVATSATKYFLRTLLMIPTGDEDDPDGHGADSRPRRAEPAKPTTPEPAKPLAATAVAKAELKQLAEYLSSLGIMGGRSFEEFKEACGPDRWPAVAKRARDLGVADAEALYVLASLKEGESDLDALDAWAESKRPAKAAAS